MKHSEAILQRTDTILSRMNVLSVDFNAVPVTKGTDGCVVGMDRLDLTAMLRDGLFLAFAPSDSTYHVKAVLRYRGSLTVTDSF